MLDSLSACWVECFSLDVSTSEALVLGSASGPHPLETTLVELLGHRQGQPGLELRCLSSAGSVPTDCVASARRFMCIHAAAAAACCCSLECLSLF